MFQQRRSTRCAASRADVIAVIGVVSVLGSLVGLSLPGLDQFPREYSQEALCQMKLAKLGYGLFMCRAENNDRGPMADDGTYAPCGMMLTWADILYDTGYIGRTDLQVCPTDARPDAAAYARGVSWQYRFVREFGVGESRKYGTRTSYAISNVITYGWTEDLYPDAARQIYVADGWWTWLANTSSWWMAGGDINQPCGLGTPNAQCDMVGFRHDNAANMLFMDGSVRSCARRIPESRLDLLRNGSFDTLQAFTWLPGELDTRLGNDRYRGSLEEFDDLTPRLGLGGGWHLSPSIPNELKPNWRTQNNAWVKLPNGSDRCDKSIAASALGTLAPSIPASGIAKPVELAPRAADR